MKLDKKSRQLRANIANAKLKELYPNPKTILRFSNHWELLIAVILSAQTTDIQVNKVTNKIFAKYKTVQDYIDASPYEFENEINSIGLYKNKAKNILAAAKIYKENFNSELPKTVAEIMTLPGAGRKTANVVIGNAYGLIEGIAIDTHAKRFAFKYGLTAEPNNVVKIERDLQELLPKEDWFHYTNRAIDYGREYCQAKNHDHENCPVYVALMEKGLL